MGWWIYWCVAMSSVEEDHHQVAPLIIRPAAAADKLEQIGNLFRLSSETLICCHCLNTAITSCCTLAAGPSSSSSTIYSASHFPIWCKFSIYSCTQPCLVWVPGPGHCAVHNPQLRNMERDTVRREFFSLERLRTHITVKFYRNTRY